MKNCVQICFQLLGTIIPPKDISKKLGILPDVELMSGEQNKKLMLPRINIWSLKSKVASDEVEDHWSELAPILNGSRDAIKEIALTGEARLTILINSRKRIPSVMIPPAMSEFAAFLNAVIDVDPE